MIGDEHHETNANALFRRLAENALDVIFRYELFPEPHLAYASPAIEKMTGYTVEEYYADRYKLQMLSLPEEWEKVHRFLESEGDSSGPLLIRWQHRDGSTIWTEQHVSLARDATGKVISAEGVIRDITERKMMEDALERKVAEEAALVEMSRAILDPQVSLDQVAQIVLNHARALTGSRHGFVSSIDPLTRDNIGHTLTEMMAGECKIAQESRNVAFKIGADGRYRGLWGESLNTQRSFFTNAPGGHPASAWTPPGHITLENFLSVPVVHGDDLLGQIALANAPDGFTQAGLEVVERLAGFYGLYLQQWRMAWRLKESARQLRRHNRILSVVADAASRFLMAIDWDQEVAALLAGLGQALEANHAFVFENFTQENGELATRQIYRWSANSLDEIEPPRAAGGSYVQAGLSRWVEVLGSGGAIAGRLKDFPQSEQDLLARRGVQSLLAMPIFTGYDWYGYLGFGNTVELKEWAAPDVDALQAAAGILGAAIERRKAENALLRRTQDLERFEKLVVGRELKMIELKQRIVELEVELTTLDRNER